ncbi:hypothetical protein yc1106_01278 [Curvularia clavata]|uniref:Uncharacterized protein n=1 Tax=Curvularia clavata TaxID=95742 RepID=A0A9Q9DPU4_CURCL|nr:hypothetical protein yc1106_01278 [Curvularia clavata]
MAEKDSSEESSDYFNAASSDEETDFDLDTKFPFYSSSIPILTADSVNCFVDEKLEEAELPSEPRTTSFQPGPSFEIYKVEYSRYLDDEYGTDEVRAELGHSPNSTTATKRDGALFRWIHLKQDPMDFGAFQNAARSLPDLTEEEADETMKLLQNSQKQVQKRFRTKDGQPGRIFGPQVLSKKIRNDVVNPRDGCFFFSLPYFCLRKYTKLSIPSQSNLQATRTLLQISDSSTPKGRDLEQAVCHLAEIPGNQCFHLSSLWCLAIKDKYLLTCSLHSGAELSGELLDILKQPPSQPSVALSERPLLLQVSFEGALYLIPLDECDSWFKLTQRFSGFRNNFDDLYNVKMGGHRIQPSQWHIVIRQARKQPMRTRITVSPRYHWSSRPPMFINELRKLSSPRPLIKALSRSDDVSNMDPSRSFTPCPSVPSSSSLASLENNESAREEQAGECPLGRIDHSSSQLKASLSPNLVALDPLKQKSPASPISLEHYLEDFHALRWIALQFPDPSKRHDSIPKISKLEAMQPPELYDKKVDFYLEELHKYMQFKVGVVTQTRYQSCATKSLKDVEKVVAEIVTTGLGNAEVLNLKQKIVTAAKSNFLIFLPLDQKGSIVSKYWGAVCSSITAKKTRNTAEMRETVHTLMRAARLCIDMQAQLSKGKGPNPTETNLPVYFVRAWFDLLICQLNLTQGNISIARKRALSFEQNIDAGIEVVMMHYEGKTLPELRALVPSELSVFFAHRVLQDMTGDFPNVLDTYRKYSIRLETLVKKDPLNRYQQTRVAKFLEELYIIQMQLSEQLNVIKKLEQGPLARREHEYRAAFSQRYHIKLLKQCEDHLSKTKDSLSELQLIGKSLEIPWREYMQSKKQRQERAMYISTIVAMIILPISTVSNIFAMNIKDIRDMNNGQWVLWAVAIPVTAVVVIGSLFSAGALSYRQ